MFTQDLRFSIRSLIKNRGFTALAIFTLTLGIGVNTAIFSVINAVLLRPLPYEEADRLVMIWDTNPELSKDSDGPSPGNFLDLREQTSAFDSVAAWYQTAVAVQGEQDAEQVQSAKVSVEFFATLRSQAAKGRVFLPGETSGVALSGSGQYVRGDRVVVISDGLWRRRFASDAALIGRTIKINSRDYKVAGVMPEGFAMPDKEVDLWMPWDIAASYNSERFPEGPPRDWRFLNVLALLKSDVTIEQAQAKIDSFASRLAEQYPKTNRGWGMRLSPLYDEIVGESRPSLLVLFATVGMVLLIACANVASLLLAKASTRQREIAIRAALGASRIRLVRQLLTESLLLSLAGAAIGLALTFAGRDMLVRFAPADVPRMDESTIDLRVLAFTVTIAIVTGIVFGLAPALRGTKTDLTTALKEGGGKGATAGLSHLRLRNAMVIAEIAIALVLLAGAGLFARSFIGLLAVEPGFDANNLLTMHINLDGASYRGSGRSAMYYRQLTERLESIPSVVSAAAVTTLPMSDVGVDFDRPYWREGEAEPGGEASKVDIRMATLGYFRTMGMTLIRGRDFAEQDNMDSPAVIIINESLARKEWPGEDPIGKRLMIDYNRGKYSYEVVGVTAGIRYYGPRSDPRPEVFIPHAQNPYLPMNVVVRTSADPAQLINAVKQEARNLDPAQPVHHIVTMEELISEQTAPDRFSLWLMSGLAVLAMLLAATGIYGVMSYVASQRAHEIGVRMALGARERDVLRLMLGESLKLTAMGICFGLIGGFALTRAISNLLYGVSPTDPLTFATVSLMLMGVAMIAGYFPARRATRVNPMEALRYE